LILPTAGHRFAGQFLHITAVGGLWNGSPFLIYWHVGTGARSSESPNQAKSCPYNLFSRTCPDGKFSYRPALTALKSIAKCFGAVIDRLYLNGRATARCPLNQELQGRITRNKTYEML
jgi:hypothetical protein